jgi:predicted DNA-binding transcriptional regulator AlpA
MEHQAHIRWVTHDELAEARGITRKTAHKLANRRGWPRRIENGVGQVAVPEWELGTRWERWASRPPGVGPGGPEIGGPKPSAAPEAAPRASEPTRS